MSGKRPWEYGFYDSDPTGAHVYEPDWSEVQTDPTIFWYVFGMNHKTAESAEHTGRKSTWGQPVIVRRRMGSTEWEQVSS